MSVGTRVFKSLASTVSPPTLSDSPARPTLPDLDPAAVAHDTLKFFEVAAELDYNLGLAICLGRNIDRQ